MQKVIPPGLNYGDIKPEAIENQIRIVKFTPIATIQSAQANDIVRFHLQGNGFYDPYSSYIRIAINVSLPPRPHHAAAAANRPTTGGLNMCGKFLDRSAHSLFSRLVIRSQGTELERIEQYDVMAAIVNDLIYSQEQRILHHYEGFSHRQGMMTPMPGVGLGNTTTGDSQQGVKLLPFVMQTAAEPLQNRVSDVGVWRLKVGSVNSLQSLIQKVALEDQFLTIVKSSADNLWTTGVITAGGNLGTSQLDKVLAYAQPGSASVGSEGILDADGKSIGFTFRSVEAFNKALELKAYTHQIDPQYPLGITGGRPSTIADMFHFETHTNNPWYGMMVGAYAYHPMIFRGDAGPGHGIYMGNPQKGPIYDLTEPHNFVYVENSQLMEFCIPIYSGIIGVMMPSKKLIPMSLLPLEIEFTMNPHAFYPVGEEVTERKYTVNRFEIWSHTMFFEQELHRSLEAAVAESGVFIHYNSFYLAPVNTYNGANSALPQYNQIGVFLKSINSIHWAFIYNSYEQENGPRKLHFVSHNVSRLQLRNGMDLMPSEPIQGQVGNTISPGLGVDNQHSPFMIEMYKGWNKMHDPSTTTGINGYNYQVDHVLSKIDTIDEFMAANTSLGTCQYAISFEGDELGTNKTMITGKKSVMPFDINLSATKSGADVSYMMCFLRADFIIYVRPDLVVTRLGL